MQSSVRHHRWRIVILFFVRVFIPQVFINCLPYITSDIMLKARDLVVNKNKGLSLKRLIGESDK